MRGFAALNQAFFQLTFFKRFVDLSKSRLNAWIYMLSSGNMPRTGAMHELRAVVCSERSRLFGLAVSPAQLISVSNLQNSFLQNSLTCRNADG